MTNYPIQNESTFHLLIDEYEAMSRKGTQMFIEETVFNRLIDYYYQEGKNDKAKQVADHALTQHPNAARLYIKKIEILMQEGLFQTALDTLEQAAEVTDLDFTLQLLRVDLYTLLPDLHTALRLLNEMRYDAQNKGHKVDEADTWFTEAMIMENLQQYEPAYYCLQEALLLYPMHSEAGEKMSIMVEYARKHPDSLRLHRHLTRVAPYSLWAWFNLAKAAEILGKTEEAADAYEYCMVIDEKWEWAYRDCGKMLITDQNWERAKRCYEWAFDHISPDMELLCEAAEAYIALGDHKKAKKHLLKAQKLGANYPQIPFLLGQIQLQAGQLEKAKAYFEKALDLDIEVTYLAALAHTCEQLGDTEEAQLQYETAAYNTDTVLHWIHYIAFLLRTEQVEVAENALEEATAVFGKEDTTLQYLQIATLYEGGKKAEALYKLYDLLLEEGDQRDILFRACPTMQHDEAVEKMLESVFLKNS